MPRLQPFSETPPDLLAVVGAYNQPAVGCAAIGSLCGFIDESAAEFQYVIYFQKQIVGSLSEKASLLSDALNFPAKKAEEGGDGGYIRNKASNGRIRSLFSPKERYGSASLVVNYSEVMLSDRGVLRREFKKIRDRDLSGYDPITPIILREQVKAIPEWIDCLHSVLVQKPKKLGDGKSEYKKIVFIAENVRADELIRELASVEIAPDGKLRNASPLTLAMLFGIGRTEWLAQTQQLAIQSIMKGAGNVL